MSIRKVPFIAGEFYHCYNRGVDKRTIFADANDFQYFLDTLFFSNDADAFDRMRERKKSEQALIRNRYVSIAAYCLNPNHFHLLLRSESDEGISKFMQRVSTSYTMYFNSRKGRTGSLFQGKFKATHIESDEQLRYVGAYVSLNNLAHNINDKKLYRSSFDIVTEKKTDMLCDSTILFNLLGGKNSFEASAYTALPLILEQKQLQSKLIDNLYTE